ncbi:MAG TPA: type VI secretion system lipoprotein TssJ [Steroidobacteraceae bacterium]|nr:type VI secretion system lipoprotein TssJ [Steroidobacteraceae bacterium]
MLRRIGATVRAACIVASLLLAFGTGEQRALADPASSPSAATTLELTIVGGPALNPNTEGRPSPVVVRVFDLAASRNFEGADYQALFEQPNDLLKQDVVAQEELLLRPGDIQERSRTLSPQVHALGIAAAFRDLDRAVWRLTVPLKPGRRNFLLIDLDKNTVRLDTGDSGRP